MTGYMSPEYVASLSAFGRPVALPRCGGFLLEREIPGEDAFDAMGPYPLFCCADWSALPADLERLARRVISVVLVTDPFGPDDISEISGAFSHGLVRYKDHHVIDLEVPIETSACAHHRRNARKALAQLTVDLITEPRDCLDSWCRLYGELIRRHRLTGPIRFSRDAFELQLSVAGLAALRAIDQDGSVVGMVLWYCQGDVGYYHLAAYSPGGYAKNASYALFWSSALQFRGRLRWLSLGAGAGATCDGTDGLTRFKTGWSAHVRPTYLGRHVACPERYAELCTGRAATDFFPAYRSPVEAVA
jgi:hypothetical protein